MCCSFFTAGREFALLRPHNEAGDDMGSWCSFITGRTKRRHWFGGLRGLSASLLASYAGMFQGLVGVAKFVWGDKERRRREEGEGWSLDVSREAAL